jgi:hypothetical protein
MSDDTSFIDCTWKANSIVARTFIGIFGFIIPLFGIAAIYKEHNLFTRIVSMETVVQLTSDSMEDWQ